MSTFYNIIYAIPVAIVYNLFVYKLADVVFKKSSHDSKIQKTMILVFFFGIVSLLIAQSFFSSNARFKNPIIKYGLVFGAIISVVYGALNYWEKITNETKLILIVIGFVLILRYSYTLVNNKQNNNNNNINIDDIIDYNTA